MPQNTPSPAPKLGDWQRAHLERYLATDGAEGHQWHSPRPGVKGPVPTLLLTTTGRRSGKPFVLPLIYGEADGSCVVVASKGGAPEHPGWYLNLSAMPEVGVQVLAKRFRAKARTATGTERESLWKTMAALFPPYNEYQQKAGREIPVVVLDPM